MASSIFIRSISILFILLLASVNSYTQGSWERINVPTSKYLRSVCFVDSLYGWVAGDSGIILHTTTGGAAWVQQETNIVNDVEYVFFLNRNLGWASSFNYTTIPYGTILLKTTDGGATWLSQPYPQENIFITCILFRDSLNGWMGGMPHALVRTTDGGVNWTQAAIDTSTLAFFPVLSIQFYNDQYGYASGGMFDIAGVTWHTSDGGNTWYAIDPVQAPADEVHGLHIFDSLHVLGAGGDPDFGYGVGLIRTNDGGQNWNYQELTIQGNAYDIDFRNDHEAWAPLGPRRKLIYSLDAGVTWTVVLTPDSTAIYDMTFPDSLHGFAVGRDGAMLKYHPPVIPSVQNFPRQGNGYRLYQNKPNPVQGATTIRFSVPPAGEHRNLPTNQSEAKILLKVYDVLGKEVARLQHEFQPPGDHEFEFDASTLPGGIYFYSLHLVTRGQTKMVAEPRQMIKLN
ncbi:MAG: YCF48-related protein [Bacteroidales bacterium]|nr:YCF48-related protein [Bacteroidales bacterium]